MDKTESKDSESKDSGSKEVPAESKDSSRGVLATAMGVSGSVLFLGAKLVGRTIAAPFQFLPSFVGKPGTWNSRLNTDAAGLPTVLEEYLTPTPNLLESELVEHLIALSEEADTVAYADALIGSLQFSTWGMTADTPSQSNNWMVVLKGLLVVRQLVEHGSPGIRAAIATRRSAFHSLLAAQESSSPPDASKHSFVAFVGVFAKYIGELVHFTDAEKNLSYFDSMKLDEELDALDATEAQNLVQAVHRVRVTAMRVPLPIVGGKPLRDGPECPPIIAVAIQYLRIDIVRTYIIATRVIQRAAACCSAMKTTRELMQWMECTNEFAHANDEMSHFFVRFRRAGFVFCEPLSFSRLNPQDARQKLLARLQIKKRYTPAPLNARGESMSPELAPKSGSSGLPSPVDSLERRGRPVRKGSFFAPNLDNASVESTAGSDGGVPRDPGSPLKEHRDDLLNSFLLEQQRMVEEVVPLSTEHIDHKTSRENIEDMISTCATPGGTPLVNPGMGSPAIRIRSSANAKPPLGFGSPKEPQLVEKGSPFIPFATAFEEDGAAQGDDSSESTAGSTEQNPSIVVASYLGTPVASPSDANRFTVFPKEQIGRGALGVVLKAWDERDGVFVAAKDVTIATSAALQEVLNEFSILVHLDHPNITHVVAFKVCSRRDHGYIFMEWMPSGSVVSVMRYRKVGFPIALIQRFARDVLRGLHYLHEKRIVHRDIKPANMLLSADGRVKLSDFGVSKYLLGQCPVLKSDTVVGTVPYLAPEVLTEGSYSEGSDIWAVGCSLLEMVTGVVPWSSRKENDLYALVFWIGSLRPPDHMPPEINHSSIDPELRAFLEACFTYDYRLRPSAEELIFHPFLREEEDLMSPKRMEPLRALW